MNRDHIVVQRIRHLTGSTKSGEPNDRPRTRSPSPTVVADVALAARRGDLVDPAVARAHVDHPDEELQLLEVRLRGRAGDVRTASVNPSGAITGTLKGGDDYTSQIPTAITDTQLAPTLKAHDVDVTGVGAGSSPPRGPPLLRPVPVVARVLHLDWTAERRAARRGDHGFRGFEGQGLRRGKAYDPIRRHRRLRGRKA